MWAFTRASSTPSNLPSSLGRLLLPPVLLPAALSLLPRDEGITVVPKHSIPGQEESRNLLAGIKPFVPFPSDFSKCFRLPLAAARSASRKERWVQAGGGCQLPKATSVQPQACLPAPAACLLKQILGRNTVPVLPPWLLSSIWPQGYGSAGASAIHGAARLPLVKY